MAPHEGRMDEEVEGKILRKAGEASQRSRRAPDCAEGLKWVKSRLEGFASRQISWRPRGWRREEERAEEPTRRELWVGGGPAG